MIKIFVIIILLIVCSGADLVPYHVYLSLTGNSDTLQVTFTTSAQPTAPEVKYWVEQAGPSKSLSIFGSSNSTLIFPNPNSTAVDYITSLTIPNVTRNTFYSYIVCGNASVDACTATLTFKSLPNDGDVLNIGFFGDLGSNGTALITNGSGGLLQYAANYSADFIVHNGDLAYNLATRNGSNGNEFMTKIEPITSKIPYVVTPGNHEFKTTADPIYYSNWFVGQTNLGKQSGSTNPTMWYSFDVGNVHIVAISTEVYCEDRENLIPQYTWLANDLAQVRARLTQPFLVVFGHRQMYAGSVTTHASRLMRLGIQCTDSSLLHCDASVPCDSGVFCRYSLEQILYKYSADIFISGHVHQYIRMFPTSPDHAFEPHNESFYINPTHPTYLISGAPGIQADAAQLGESDLATNVVKMATGHSFSHMTVFNSSHLYIKQIDVLTGDIIDDFWIIKDSSQPNWNTFEKFFLFPSLEPYCD